METTQNQHVHLGWRFRWYRDWESVWSPEVGVEWSSMLQRCQSSSVYHRPEFIRAWAKTLGAGVTPLVGICRHHEGHSILLPWVLVRHGGRFVERRVVEYAGRELSGYQDPLVVTAPGASLDWNDFWHAVALATAPDCDQGRMRYVSSDFAPVSGSPVGEPTPVLDLSRADTLDALLARCSPNHRGDVKRRLRRLEERGQLDLHVASSGDYEEVARDIRDGFLVQHSAVCAEKGYSDPFRATEAASFLDALFGTGLSEGWAFYGRLRVDGEAIAWILGLVHNHEFYWWRPTYHPAWMSFSPGKALLALTLDYGLKNGWRRVHFHAGGQRYKLAWKPELPPMSSVIWYPSSVRSSSLFWYDRFVGSR